MKFSIITPAFNSARFLEETILSVISQKGQFSIQYIIQDNCSTDDTRKIVEKYKNLLESGSYPIQCEEVGIILTSENDNGMYDAINKGFAKAIGDIFAWINADDIYLPGAFSLIERIFHKNPEISWVKGITSYLNEQSQIWSTGKCWLYSREFIQEGSYGRDLHFIQQDSVFWRSRLWQISGGIDVKYKRAGDYFLWQKFATASDLVSVCSQVSCFRTVEGQLSQDMKAYMQEVLHINKGQSNFKKRISFISRSNRILPKKISRILFRLMFGKLSCKWISIDGQNDLSINIHEFTNIAEHTEA